MDSNVLADSSVNTFHFDDSGGTGDPADIAANLATFYNQIRGLYSSDVAQNDHVLKVYDLDDPQPRVPVVEDTFDFSTAPTGSPLPHQVSICASFQGTRISGVAQASRRGRVYIGPLSTSMVTTGGRVLTGAITDLNTAMENLQSDSIADNLPWGVWSRVLGELATVNNGWVDNSFDIQRRRQRQPVTRTTWTA